MTSITSIIIAEDDHDDRLLIEEALNESGIKSSDLKFVDDGEELIKLMSSTNHRPCMIILDLNMPRKDGRQALQELKSNEEYKDIPVIIFSTSSASEDVRMSYKSGANTYFTKPSSYKELVEIFRSIKSYWCDRATISDD